MSCRWTAVSLLATWSLTEMEMYILWFTKRASWCFSGTLFYISFFNYEHKVATCILVYKSGNNRTSAFLILWRSKGELGFNNTGNLFYLGFETDWSGWVVWREKQVDIFHCCCLCRETANWWKNSHLVRQWIYFDTWQKSYFLSFPGATQGGIRKAAGEY